jgi:hypothetical protein
VHKNAQFGSVSHGHTTPSSLRSSKGRGKLATGGIGDGGWWALFFLVFYSYRLEIFRFEDLPAIKTFNVVDAVAARDYLRPLVVTGGLHKKGPRYDPF